MKDHEIAAVVGELTKLAREFGATQQLRERIAYFIVPVLRGAPPPQSADDQTHER